MSHTSVTTQADLLHAFIEPFLKSIRPKGEVLEIARFFSNPVSLEGGWPLEWAPTTGPS
jgi:hypothetical protein